MKKHLLTLAVISISLFAFAQDDSQRDISIIDAQDSVVFDLYNAGEQSGYVEFPVKILSDDVINSVDFSLNYDTAAFAYDTIIKLAPYLSITANETGNKTVFFTSFSLQTITNDTPLVKVRFQVLSGHFCSSSMNSVMVYLNGDACSAKIVECVFAIGIDEAQSKDDLIDVYPNPAQGAISLRFNSDKNETLRLIVSDMTGKIVYENQANAIAGLNKLNANLDFLSKGIYSVQLIRPSGNLIRKIALH